MLSDSLSPRYHYKICEDLCPRHGQAGPASASPGSGAGMEMFNRFRFKGETKDSILMASHLVRGGIEKSLESIGSFLCLLAINVKIMLL